MVTVVNLGAVVVFLLFLASGYRQGLLWKLISILGFFVVGWLSWMLSDPLSGVLALYPKQQVPLQGTIMEGMLYDFMNRLLLFVILFILLEVLLLVLKPIAHLAQRIPLVSSVNRICGILLGGVQGILILSVCAFLMALPFWSQGKAVVDQSLLRYCAPMTSALWGMVEKPLMELSSVNLEGTSISDEEKLQLEAWLLDKNIDKESVNAIMEAFR